MPIKGLTKSKERLPILGAFRKGAVKRPKSPGQPLDYFRFTSANPLDSSLVDEVKALVGEKPRQIRFWLPYDGLDDCFEAWMETYSHGGLQIRCDGESVRMLRTEDGRMVDYPEGAMLCQRSCECETRARLHIVVHGLQRDGVVVVPTGSKIDIRSIHSALHLHANRAKRFGVKLTDLPLVLLREPQDISVPAFAKGPDGKFVQTGKRTRKTHWMVKIQAAPEYSAFLDRIRVSRLEHASKLLGAAEGVSIGTSPTKALSEPPTVVVDETPPAPPQPTAPPAPKAEPAAAPPTTDEGDRALLEQDLEKAMKDFGLLTGDFEELDDLRLNLGLLLWRKLDGKGATGTSPLDELSDGEILGVTQKLGALRLITDDIELRRSAWMEMIDAIRARRVKGGTDLHPVFLAAVEQVIADLKEQLPEEEGTEDVVPEEAETELDF